MNQLTPFAFDSHAIRVVNLDGATWFVGKDVALALGYADPTNAIKQHCRGVVKHHPILDALGRTQEARLLTEPDVFRLIVGSRLPAAERFEQWVFEEVLPTLRRTGQWGQQRDWVAEQAQLQGLVAAIRAEGSPEVRAALHGQLAQFCARYELPVPSLTGIVAATPAAATANPALVLEFMDTVDACEAAGARLNHARDATLRAYNLPQARAVALAHGRPLPAGRALLDALHADAAFVAVRAVNSLLTGRTVKCWVFASGGQA